MKLLVIACGRSGTRYASKVFQLAGLDVGHEVDAPDGKVDWRAICRPEDLNSHGLILHQVREPLATIASWHTVSPKAWRCANRRIPSIGEGETLLARCMRYWLYWNRCCAAAARLTYRVEDLPKRLPEFMTMMGRRISDSKFQSVVEVPTNEHSRTHQRLEWDDLMQVDPMLAGEIAGDAQKYGYELRRMGA